MKKIIIILILTMTLIACGNNENSSMKNNKKKIKVGIIQFTQHIALDRSREGFIKGLEDKGYIVEEKTVNVSGDIGLIPVTAKKFEAEGVDMIYAIATPAAQGAKNVVKDIPIIFNAVTNPIEANLVDSNEEPGSNISGVSDYYPLEKQLKNFLDLFPNSKKLGVLYSPGEINSEVQIKELEKICKSLRIELVKTGVTTTNDVASAMNAMVSKIDSYIAIQDNLASSSASIISKILIENKIPSFAGEVGPVENGILLSDGLDYFKLGEEATNIAIEIFEGKKIKEIPVVFSKDVERTINEDTAKKLGINKNSKIFKEAKLIK
ncbi:MAG: ABC transporter substrate-binding protein [Peptoniphilaceae bacterium]